jgi:peroxiredoxin (alkyl hydroperoxide reductase subunit C)
MADIHGMPRIGDPAPDFTAMTTQGQIRFSEWQGDDWVVLFSHPADFTPVCTTELAEFARRADDFKAQKTKLIGLSVDSVHAHLAWLLNMKEKLGVRIPYPVIADLDMKVAQLYGMIHEQASATAAVRAVFVIDSKRTIRAIIYYPMNTGRNVDEIVRLVTALQTADEYACSMPVNWTPGDKVIVPPPQDVKQMEDRLRSSEYEVKDFYLSFKKLPGSKATP